MQHKTTQDCYLGNSVKISLLNHMRHNIHPIAHLGRNRQIFRRMVGFGNLVFAQAQRHFVRVRHRLDAAGVHRLHFFHQFKHGVQFFQCAVFFVVA